MLKKPSDYFKKDIVTVNNSVKELVKTPELNTFSDAFESFKNNLSKIEVLSEFSDTLDNYRVNIEKVNYLSDKVEDIQTEVQSLLKKEDLDRAMMSQLLVVEQSIRDVQSKVKGINEKNLTEIRLDVSGLTESVNEFLEVEVPRYKKLVVDSELRTNNRYEELEDNVNKTLEGIGEFVDNKYQELTENLQGINEQSLAGILEDFKLLDANFAKLKEEEIPRYKGFIVETERKTESKLEDFDAKTDSKLDEFNQQLLSFEENVKDRIDNVQTSLKEFVEVESPKHKGFIVETERKLESKLQDFDSKTDSKFEEFNQQLLSFEKNVKDRIDDVQTSLKEFVEVEAPKYSKLLIENKLKTEEEVKVIQKNIEEKVSQFVSDIETLKSNALNESKEIDKFVTEKIGDFKKVLTETQKDVKKTLSTYTSISKTFEKKVLTDNEKLNSYDESLKDFSGKINECLSQVLLFKEEIEINEEIQNEWKEVLKEELSQRIKKYKDELNEEVVLIQNDLSKKVSDLEINIVRNESHLKVQNKNLEQIQEDVRSAIQKLNLEDLEEKNYELGKKVKYLEEVFEKFNEKEILTESIVAEPPSTDSKDPLTPLDQNFVTLEQLQNHYRLFINRIQQQIATIGGGGETRLEFLDDVDRNSAKTDGYVLTYDSVLGKFKGAPAGSSVAVGAAGTWSVDSVGINTTKSVGIGTAADAALKLKVQGDSQVVGKLTVSDLYFDGSDFVEINAGISTLNITSDTITIGSSLQPSSDSVYDLGSPTRQWKELYLSGQTLYLAGVPISLSQTVNRTTISIGNTALVTQPELNALDQEVEFISSGIANVGYYDASAGQIVKLTELGAQSGYYTVGQPLPNSGIITSHYFVVSNNGNNIGAGNTYIQTGVTTSYVGDWVAGIGTNQWGVLSFSSATIVPLSSNSNNLDGQSGSYYLDYNNFTNTPTIPTNNNQLTNGAGFVTFTNVSQLNNDSGYITAGSTFSGNYNDLTNTPTIPTNNNQLTNGAGYVTSSGTVALSQGLTGTPNINVGIVTASAFVGDGSGLTGIVASGTGIVVQNNGSNVGTASTINFGSTLGATFVNGTATINASIPLSALTDVNTSNLTGISTDYLMVYDPSVPGFKFVDPKTYFGINNDANPAPDIVDYGDY